MQKKDFPQNFKGYSTEEILKTWEEIKTPEGTKASESLIRAMRQFLRKFRLGVFQHHEPPKKS